MDSEYLENTLGKALTECLTEVCLKRPSDPIEYIALWLYKHDANLKLEAEEAKEKAELDRLRREKQLEKERLEKLYMESLRLEEEERERLRLLELERLRQLELERARELEEQRQREESKPAQEPSPEPSENVMIEIGIKTHQTTSPEPTGMSLSQASDDLLGSLPEIP